MHRQETFFIHIFHCGFVQKAVTTLLQLITSRIWKWMKISICPKKYYEDEMTCLPPHKFVKLQRPANKGVWLPKDASWLLPWQFSTNKKKRKKKKKLTNERKFILETLKMQSCASFINLTYLSIFFFTD